VLRQSDNLKTITKLENYKMYEIDTSRDKSHDFDFLTDTNCKIFAEYRPNIFLTFKQFNITIATTMYTLPTKLFSISLRR
jgi:hypothetical protein